MAEGFGAGRFRVLCAPAALIAVTVAAFALLCGAALAVSNASRAKAHASKVIKLKKLTRPTISGVVEDGQVLTAHNGAWQGPTPIYFSYQWQVCRGGCSPIPEATEPTYRVDTAQIGNRLQVLITAKDAQGASVARSTHTARVLAGPPVNTAPPAISGTPTVGQTLEASTGSWAGTPSFSYSYQWLSCNILGECLEIADATEPTYTVPALDVASTLEVLVTTRSHTGEASATSQASAPVAAVAPLDEELPTITGRSTDGQLLSVLVGEWEGTGPLAYSYQWQLCNAKGEECANISEAVAATLSLISADVGKTVRVAVTATNSGGSMTATSSATSAIAALAPSNIELPSVSGALLDGQVLTALTGSWSGSTPLSYSYQWEQCNATGGECSSVSEALAGTLSLVSADVGKTVRVAVTATNSGGSTTVTSPATNAVAALLPSDKELPSVVGSLVDGQALKALIGSWSGSTPLSYSYQWQLCNAKGEECANVSEAFAATLSLVSSEVGKTARVVVTATNSGGSVTATSPATSAIAALLPSSTSLPEISGLLKVGQLLHVSTGSWSGTTPITYTYQWQSCLLGSCKNIAKAVENVLKLELADVGLALRVIVTATNPAGSVSADSSVTGLLEGLL